jgi:uncharacterized membrane protein
MNSTNPPQRGSEEKETTRVEAFSDGVFAIAITLLVLDLKVPRAESLPAGSTLWQYLLGQWPVFTAYLVSFCTILIMWVSHHRLFNQIHRTDDVFMYINGLLLLFISVTPFPTSLLAEHLQHEFAPTAMAIYAGNSLIIAVLFNALWRYAAYKNRLLQRNADPVFVKGVNKQYWIGPPLYLAAFVLAFINVAASIATCALLAIFFALTSFLSRNIFGRDSTDRN